MKTFLISNKLKLAVSLFLSVFIFVIGLVVAGPDFAKANDEQLQNNGDRVVKLNVYNGAYGRITDMEDEKISSITIPAAEATDEYTLNWVDNPEEENAADTIKILRLTCGTFKQDIKVVLFENRSSGIMLLDVYGSDHYPSATPYSFSGLDVESDGTNNFEVCFYGSEVFAGAVYGSPENKHSCFTLTVTCDDPIFIGIFGKNTITLKTLMESIGHAWGYDENPEYLFEVISADSSIIQGRQYTISDDGTIHVQIETTLLSIYHVQAQLNAKAIGVSGAVFKNWVLNNNVITDQAGVIPAPEKIYDDFYGYKLVAEYYEKDVCQITFDSQGGSAIKSQIVEKGEKASKPADPTKENCKFGGWYTNAECTGTSYDFTQAVNDSFTLYAKWIEIPHIIEGGDAVWYYGSAQGLTFKSSAKLTDFLRVTVDGDEVDASAYTLGTDETITVTLSPDYMNFMSEGTHELGIVSNFVSNEETVSKCNFTVTFEPVNPVNPTSGPATGDYVLWIAFLFVIFGCLVFVSSKLRRLNNAK